ncbi:putative disease resistance RPP13-like protein 3 [Solanum lycopersicum]|uniref:putative disease resistance RPP13-like protein 3 n=1 Tax=Solanum lycopersicum TaxID=4081 RepID=UPI003749A393
MADAFVSFAVKKLGDFLIQEVSLLTNLRDEVRWLRNDLLFMQSFLRDAELKQCGDQRVQQWVFEINSIANDAVAILETYSFKAGKGDDQFASCLKGCACICKKDTKFYKVSKEIQSLKQRIMDISRKRETYGITNINSTNSGDGSSKRPNNPSAMVTTLRRTTSYVDGQDHIFVGFQDVVERLLSELLKEEPRRSVISIYGMGGLGKTTLARNLYISPDIVNSFHTRAWICVSQEYNTVDLLRKLLDVRAMTSTMERLAKDMVDKCGGLPLAIVVLSGLLSHKRGPGEWKKVKDRLWKNIEEDSIEISYILSLSYNDLSTELKQCFLYFGIFPEDQELEAENVIRLWMAEGFIPRGQERMEDVAEGFLNELIRRSLVQVARTFWEKVTECKVHDLLRDLAIQKALELDTLGGTVPHAIGSLYHLKFLSLGGIGNLPSSIGNLKNLQTLCVKSEFRHLCQLPPETADLINLRHLVAPYSEPLLQKLWLDGRIQKLSLLPNSITMMVLLDSKLMEDPMPILGMLPNLRKLEVLRAYQGKEIFCSDNSFPQLEFLSLACLENLDT